MKSDNSFSRGRYGILPESRVSAHQKWRFGVRICVATIMSRWCSLFSRPLRKVSTESELIWIERACNTVDFEVVRPLWAPRGHTISGLVEIPGSPSIATFVFPKRGRRTIPNGATQILAPHRGGSYTGSSPVCKNHSAGKRLLCHIRILRGRTN